MTDLVFPREGPELLIAAGVWQCPAIKDEPAAVSGIIRRNLFPVGKAVDGHYQVGSFNRRIAILRFGDHGVDGLHQGIEPEADLPVLPEVPQVAHREGNALEKMGLVLIISPEAVSPERLEYPDQRESVIIMKKFLTVNRVYLRQAIQVIMEKFPSSPAWGYPPWHP